MGKRKYTNGGEKFATWPGCPLMVVALAGMLFSCQSSSKPDYTKYVNPFIGTSAAGHTFPGACTPFGMVQVSPETGFAGWDYCAGYRYEDSTIMGFSHTHHSGTGWMDLGDILLMPFTGEVKKDKYRSRFSHQNESASPGYYSVLLEDYDVNVELTATPRAAFHRLTFNKPGEKHLLIDLQHGLVPDEKFLEKLVVKSSVKVTDDHTVSGFRITDAWAKDKQVYFVIKFSRPIVSHTWLSPEEAERNHKLVLTFENNESGSEIDVKIALSTVSIENAEKNLEMEIPAWNFGRIKNNARKQWNTYLSKIEIEGDDKQKELFYTSLYHTLINPNDLTDVDSSYRGADRKVYRSGNGAYYSSFSLWDTFRATHPLYTLICPEKVNEMIAGMLEQYDVKGYLPVWPIWTYESHGMIGNHAIPVIVDAYMKGIRGYDTAKAYEAVKASATPDYEPDWKSYLKYGYIPYDIIKRESVSKTLEYGFDDWCVAQMAKSLGYEEDYTEYTRRSKFYKNLFDSSTGLMRPKDSTGKWEVTFDPFVHRFTNSPWFHYTEANAWQYTWHVMQDIEGLKDLMGGTENFALKLDSLFFLETPYREFARRDENMTGMIGQYAHGNEPGHHIPYLYQYAGQPWKTQEKVNRIVTTLYDTTPGGICGNEDCGQMSAWYVFSSLGFYPVNPANGNYVFGTPLHKKATIHVNGNPFIIEAKNLSPENIYIQAAEFNGKPYAGFFISHRDIARGGRLVFTMGPNPKKN